MDKSAVHNNIKNGQFEFRTKQQLATLTYRIRKKTMFFMHTKVSDALSGQGIASTLTLAALSYAKSEGYLIAVMCPFVSKYVDKNPQWYDLFDGEYHERFRGQKRL